MRISLIVASAVLSVSGCAGGSPTNLHLAATALAKIAARGTITVAGASVFGDEDWPTCTSPTGYDDVAEGGSVTVTDPRGTVVAMGRIGPGKTQRGYDRSSSTDDHCVFSLAVDVPAGLRFYGIAVGHRNAVQFTEAELGQVAITLGS